MIFKESFGLVDVGKCFSSILDVRSEEGGIIIDGAHFFLTAEVVLGGVSIAVVVVLEGCGKDNFLFLCERDVTFLLSSAVSSMIFVFEVTEEK